MFMMYWSSQLAYTCCRYTNLAGQAGNRPQDVYEPTLGRIIPYQVCIAFIGIFMVMIIKKVGAQEFWVTIFCRDKWALLSVPHVQLLSFFFACISACMHAH